MLVDLHHLFSLLYVGGELWYTKVLLLLTLDARPTFSGTTRGRKTKGTGNYTAPVGFVSAGVQKVIKFRTTVFLLIVKSIQIM